MNSMERYRTWVESDYFDRETREELMSIKDDPKEIEERFYKELEFGTGGLRGIIGAGTNRINKYTIRKASQGLADYFLAKDKNAGEKGIVIAYDSRHKSPEFALEASRVFAGNGIMVYLFDELRPTPELSFAVRKLNACGGVVITASHNPPEYNGYKVYGEDGAQMSLDDTKGVLEYIRKIKDLKCVRLVSENDARSRGLLKTIGSDIDNDYISKIKTISVNPEIIRKAGDILKIVYTPLNGAGNKPVRRILRECGCNRIFTVKEQEYPDPEFSTVKYPNPENRDALELAVKLAVEKDADLIIATDPDCDRLGVGVKNKPGEYVILTGNQVGCLLLEYIISQKKQSGKMPDNPFVMTTVVSSKMAEAICNNFNVELIEVLTGFKFIGEKIRQLDEYGNKNFIFGFEESIGYLAGTYSRDKDAVVASMLVSEMAAWYLNRNMTLLDGLESLYKKYGYYLEKIESYVFKGKSGTDKIQSIMKRLRNEEIIMFGSHRVVELCDYQKSEKYNIETGLSESINLPSSNVLCYKMKDDSWFCIRPSGTEPKIKVYFGVKNENRENAKVKLADLSASVSEYVNI